MPLIEMILKKAKELNKNSTEPIGLLLTKILELIEEIKNSQIQKINVLESPKDELTKVLDETQEWYKMIIKFAENNLISFEEAVKKYGITNETRILIKLYAALECYQEKNISEGDRYLKLVEETNEINTLKIEILLNYVKSIKANTQTTIKSRTLK